MTAARPDPRLVAMAAEMAAAQQQQAPQVAAVYQAAFQWAEGVSRALTDAFLPAFRAMAAAGERLVRSTAPPAVLGEPGVRAVAGDPCGNPHPPFRPGG